MIFNPHNKTHSQFLAFLSSLAEEDRRLISRVWSNLHSEIFFQTKRHLSLPHLFIGNRNGKMICFDWDHFHFDLYPNHDKTLDIRSRNKPKLSKFTGKFNKAFMRSLTKEAEF